MQQMAKSITDRTRTQALRNNKLTLQYSPFQVVSARAVVAAEEFTTTLKQQ